MRYNVVKDVSAFHIWYAPCPQSRYPNDLKCFLRESDHLNNSEFHFMSMNISYNPTCNFMTYSKGF